MIYSLFSICNSENLTRHFVTILPVSRFLIVLPDSTLQATRALALHTAQHVLCQNVIFVIILESDSQAATS